MRIIALAYLVVLSHLRQFGAIDFRAVEMTEAVERFRHSAFLDLGIGSALQTAGGQPAALLSRSVTFLCCQRRSGGVRWLS